MNDHRKPDIVFKTSDVDIDNEDLATNPKFNRSVVDNPSPDRFKSGMDDKNILPVRTVKKYTFITETSFSQYKTVEFEHKLKYRPIIIGSFINPDGITKPMGAASGSQMWLKDIDENKVVVGYQGINGDQEYSLTIIYFEKDSI